jgi:SAM-dependent methyltransferase
MFRWDLIQYRPDGKVLLLWRHERLFEEGLIKKGTEVCDVGGWGHLSERIMQEGGTCLILDKFTEDQYYPERVMSLPHVRMDICKPIKGLSLFDVVTCFEVLEHVDNQEQAIKNMYALLKPGGWVAGTVPIPGGTHPADDPHVHFIDEHQLRLFLEAAGFRNITIESTPSINKEDTFHPSLYYKGQKP